jgi:glutamine synthetase
LGGILNSAEALSSFFNPSINSYRRIDAPVTTSGATWSPSKISYTGNNRTHMIRVPDPGRFELRLMDGSANPYLLQAGIIAAGKDGMDKKKDPGKPLLINMYTDYKDYPHLKKLPSELESALEKLDKSKELNEAFGEKVITSYIKLKNNEINGIDSSDNEESMDQSFDLIASCIDKIYNEEEVWSTADCTKKSFTSFLVQSAVDHTSSSL